MPTMMTTFPPTFLSKYKPKFVHDFPLELTHLNYLQTLLDLDDFNLLCVGNSTSGKSTFLYALIQFYYGVEMSEHHSQLLFIQPLKEQGIHFFRNDMKTFCQSRSTIPGKKKMIVVDDLDTLPQQNQQIFCNYLDKYRNNVTFISVCNSVRKVAESIQSRLHVLPLPSPSPFHLQQLLDKIMTNESLPLDKSSQEFVLNKSQRSPRYIINLMEKLCLIRAPQTTLELCKTAAMGISTEYWERFLATKSVLESVKIVYEIYDQGYSVIDILDSFYFFIKTTQVVEEDLKYRMIPIICHYIIVFHTVHEESIELAFFAQDIYHMILPG